MERYPIKIRYTINECEHIAHARPTISFDEILLLGDKYSAIVNELQEHSLWFVALFARASLIIEFFTDIYNDGEGQVNSELVYGSTLYEQLLKVIDDKLLNDIISAMDRITLEITRKSSTDIFIDKLVSVISGWDKRLSENINPQKLGKLISKLSALKLDNEMVSGIVTKMFEKGGADIG